jgi:hypothetical protein
MIIFFEHGQLGNQLFQYAALRAMYPSERLLLFGFEDLDAVVEPVDATIIKRTDFPRWIPFGLARLLLFVLFRFRLITGLSEHKSEIGCKIVSRVGLLFWVQLCHSSFFQHRQIIEKLDPAFKVRSEHVEKARTWLSQVWCSHDASSLVFVHIRRGDYLRWPSHEKPAVLQLDWFVKAMDRIKANVSQPLFIVVTDDPFYANDVFQQRSDVLISDNSQYIDFALMTLCPNGILSPSSFAWWGAWLSRKVQNGEGIFLAPSYWGGHRCKRWIPEGFTSDWISYIE